MILKITHNIITITIFFQFTETSTAQVNSGGLPLTTTFSHEFTSKLFYINKSGFIDNLRVFICVFKCMCTLSRAIMYVCTSLCMSVYMCENMCEDVYDFMSAFICVPVISVYVFMCLYVFTCMNVSGCMSMCKLISGFKYVYIGA